MTAGRPDTDPTLSHHETEWGDEPSAGELVDVELDALEQADDPSADDFDPGAL